MIMPPADPSSNTPFSTALLELFQAFNQARTIDERRDLSKQIAAMYASERDITDWEASEEYHEFFEAYERAALAYEQQADKLSRLAINMIGQYLQQNKTDIDTLLTPVVPAVSQSN